MATPKLATDDRGKQARSKMKGRFVKRPYFGASGNLTGTNCELLITFGAPSG